MLNKFNESSSTHPIYTPKPTPHPFNRIQFTVLPLKPFDLEHLDYQAAYQKQLEHHQHILDTRKTPQATLGHVLMIEHPPTITITKRPEAKSHITSNNQQLKDAGITLHETDRGGDVTYHGPGQLVSYPIIDLNAAKLRIHNYIRLLEQSVIDTLNTYDIIAHTDPSATGVWIDPTHNPKHTFQTQQPAKICAIGVRVRKWITLHGLALNLNPDMSHFTHLIPCGLTNRPVISISQILTPNNTPSLQQLSQTLTQSLQHNLEIHINKQTPSQ